MKEFSIDLNSEGQRIDLYLSEQFEDRSRSYIQKIIKDGYVKVNQKPVKSNYRLSFDDRVEVTLPEAKEPDIVPENIPLDILYEDQDIIMINKPKQMVVHPAPGHYSGTLVNALMYHCGNELSGINGCMRPGIVHRIDMDTTGSLVICKNDNMISINAAIEVDFFGQVCAESVGTKHMSGSGGQIDFVRGACQSKGGKSFIAFTSTAKGGTISKIKPILTPGAVCTTSKNDVDYIVTEYGIAHMRGRSLGERTRQLIAIAHPDFRDELTFEAKKRGIII